MQLNEVYLAGFLGRDAEIFQTANGKLIVTLSLATTIKEKTSWFKVKVFEPWANSAKEFSKGDNVFVKGTISENKWTEKQTGKERTSLEILAFVTTRFARAEAGNAAWAQKIDSQGIEAPSFEVDNKPDVELPF